MSSNKTTLTPRDVHNFASDAAYRLRPRFAPRRKSNPLRVYGVPRGGVPAVYALIAAANEQDFYLTLANSPSDADIIFDDIIDSGATRDKYLSAYPNRVFDALLTRGENFDGKTWIVFPWEGTQEAGIEDNVVRLLQYVGEDPQRGGLLETPGRVARAWLAWTSGYRTKVEDVLKTFEDGADKVDEMVAVRNIPFYSHCEHHMAPFFGSVTIAYIPDGRIVGLSKLSRLTDIFARRLQVQERLTNQIADALVEHLHPKGVGVIVTARHLCMESRGICKQGADTVTSALRGAMKENASARAEFLGLL